MFYLEVMTLAREKHLQDGIGIVDVAMNIVAFEAMNNVRVEVRLSVVDRHGSPDIQIAALAHMRDIAIGEASPLASVNVSCLASRLTTVDAALIHALYQLDSMLAQNEM